MNSLGSEITNDFAETIDDFIQRGKNFVPKAHLSKFFPNLLNWIHLRRIRRDEIEFNVLGDAERAGFMPRSPITAQQDHIIRIFL